MSIKEVKQLYEKILQENRVKYRCEFEELMNLNHPYDFHNYENGTYYTVVFWNVPQGWKLGRFTYEPEDQSYSDIYLKNPFYPDEKLRFLLEELDIEVEQSSRYANFD